PPHEGPLPVKTPVKLFLIRLYWPNKYPISRSPTPISPAGTSVSAPICRLSSVIKLWQNRMISLSDLSPGSQSAPPLPAPKGSPVRLFLKVCSNARNFNTLRLTVGENRNPPLYGPKALFICTR